MYIKLNKVGKYWINYMRYQNRNTTTYTTTTRGLRIAKKRASQRKALNYREVWWVPALASALDSEVFSSAEACMYLKRA